MYVVIDKETRAIIHINPAPVSQQLKGQDVYYDFDAATMEIGEADIAQIPEHFKLTPEGLLREYSLQEKYDAGLIQLSPMEKIVGDQIVPKTLTEQIDEGILTLASNEKIIGTGEEETIVFKTLSEQVQEGILPLTPEQKIVGEGANEQIVAKRPSELVAEGLLEVAPTQKIVEEHDTERVVEKLLSEQIAEGLIPLSPKQKLIGEGYGEEIVEKSKQELLDEGIITIAELREEAIRKLRAEVASYYEEQKTPNNYRLDQLARQKVNFSVQFLHVSSNNETKQQLLGKRLIYPDHILEEILEEIAKVQHAYDDAAQAITSTGTGAQAVEALEQISLESFLAGT